MSYNVGGAPSVQAKVEFIESGGGGFPPLSINITIKTTLK